jgi:hypothetical protein
MDKSGNKKDKLSFRGTVDILDIIATDVGDGSEFFLWYERAIANDGQTLTFSSKSRLTNRKDGQDSLGVCIPSIPHIHNWIQSLSSETSYALSRTSGQLRQRPERPEGWYLRNWIWMNRSSGLGATGVYSPNIQLSRARSSCTLTRRILFRKKPWVIVFWHSVYRPCRADFVDSRTRLQQVMRIVR